LSHIFNCGKIFVDLDMLNIFSCYISQTIRDRCYVAKMCTMSRSTYPAILKEIWLPILEFLPSFHQFFKKNKTSISYSLWNITRKVLKLKFKKKLIEGPKWFHTRRFLWEFPIGSYVKLSSAVAAIATICSMSRSSYPAILK
jgi:hypothetical protein